MPRAAALCVAALLVLGCKETPPPPSTPPEVPFKAVETRDWTLQIPQDWHARSPGLYVGPDRANVLVNVRDNAQSLEALSALNLMDLRQTHADYTVLEHRKGTIGGLPAEEVMGRFTGGSGKAITQLTVVVDEGRRKAILTLSVVSRDHPNHAADFGRIVASFRFVSAASGD